MQGDVIVVEKMKKLIYAIRRPPRLTKMSASVTMACLRAVTLHLLYIFTLTIMAFFGVPVAREILPYVSDMLHADAIAAILSVGGGLLIDLQQRGM